MANKVGATQTPPHDDEFEPLCRWRREEGCDTVVVYVPEFKKEQLKVQISSVGIIKISGERRVHENQRSHFYKEVRIPEYCIPNEIHAKFAHGLLHIILPKRTIRPQEQTQPIKSQIPKQNTKLQDQEMHENGKGKEKVIPSENATCSGISPANYELQSGRPVAKMAVVKVLVTVVVVVVLTLGGYVMYTNRCSQD